MKLLLTSSGVTNDSIRQALVDLLGKPIEDANALFIPTAIYPFPGGARMAWEAMCGRPSAPLGQLGWKSMGVLELSALTSIDRGAWAPSVEESDALLVWGGDPVYLSYWMKQSGLADLLKSMQRELVYVGCQRRQHRHRRHVSLKPIRIGLPPRAMRTRSQEIVFDSPAGEFKRLLVTTEGAGFVDFAVIPHMDHQDHQDACGANAAKWAAMLPVPVYAIDDQSAVKVAGGVIEVVSEGHWQLFEPR